MNTIILGFIHQYNFDGLDLDWEYPGSPKRGGKSSDRSNFGLFVHELKTEFQRQNPYWELTIAMPIGTSENIHGYDVPSLCR